MGFSPTKDALIALLLAVPLASAAPPVETSCTCEAARLDNGWCDGCGIGYVASVGIKSHMLYEALDAHGHEIDPDSIECRTCQAALASDGFCESCNWGFVGKELYFSRLTYHLARGEIKDVRKLTCRVCVKNARQTKLPLEGQRWCDACGLGMVGNVAFRDRKDYEAASKELERLLKAVRTLERCEYCAVALFMDARCPRCGISYKDGKRTEADAPHPHDHPHEPPRP